MRIVQLVFTDMHLHCVYIIDRMGSMIDGLVNYILPFLLLLFFIKKIGCFIR